MRWGILCFLFYSFLFFQSCSSGSRDLKRGLYKDAVFKSMKQLRKRPENDKARHTLKKAYKHVVDENTNRISAATSKSDIHKWDEIVDRYRLLQLIYNELQRCPACLEEVVPQNFTEPLEYALKQGAQAHYDEGLRLMALQTKHDARIAHRNFLKTKNYVSNFGGIEKWLDKSFNMALVRVLIKPLPVGSRVLNITSEFFDNEIREEANRLRYRYVQFYSPSALTLEDADEIISLKFDDYVIGQTYVQEKIRNLRRDSIEIGSIKLEDGSKQKVYGPVEAEFHLFTKSVKSTGLLDFKRINNFSQSVIEQRKFPGTFVWEHQWASYKGDKKALSKDEYQLTRYRELIPPSPQDLFFQFTRPIFSQVLSQIRQSYVSLRY